MAYKMTAAEREEALREVNALIAESQGCSAYCETMENRGKMTWSQAKERWRKLPHSVKQEWHGLKEPRAVNEEAREKCWELIAKGNTEVQQVLNILLQMTV